MGRSVVLCSCDASVYNGRPACRDSRRVSLRGRFVSVGQDECGKSCRNGEGHSWVGSCQTVGRIEPRCGLKLRELSRRSSSCLLRRAMKLVHEKTSSRVRVHPNIPHVAHFSRCRRCRLSVGRGFGNFGRRSRCAGDGESGVAEVSDGRLLTLRCGPVADAL